VGVGANLGIPILQLAIETLRQALQILSKVWNEVRFIRFVQA
jgi:hypothetical protein